jgi:hypothetical protein
MLNVNLKHIALGNNVSSMEQNENFKELKKFLKNK